MSDFEAIETREQFEEAVKDRLEQERETVRREFSGCLSPEAVEEKYKEYLSPKEAEEKYKGIYPRKMRRTKTPRSQSTKKNRKG